MAPFLMRRFLIIVSRISALIAVLMPEAGATPTENYNLREWRQGTGLPTDSVTQVLQDKHGFLWVATRDGLVRFDGSNFVKFPLGAESSVTAIVETSSGEILAAPRTGSLFRIHQGLVTGYSLPQPYAEREINAMAASPDGAIWYSLGDTALRISGDDVSAFTVTPATRTNVVRFATDGKKRFWIASGTSLFRYENGSLIPFPLEGPESEVRIASSHDGGPWIVTASSIGKLDDSDHLVHVTSIPPMIGAHYINALCESRDGALWLGTRSQGVHRATRQGVQHVATSHEDVAWLIEDSEGAIWVATVSGGLKTLAPKVYRLYNKATGLGSNSVSAVSHDKQGNIWMANGDGGIVRMAGSELQSYATVFGNKTFGGTSVAADGAGGAWVSGSTGLFRIHAGSDRLAHVDLGSATGVRRLLFAASNGDLWMSIDPRGIGRFRDGTLTIYRADEGFSGDDIRAISEGNDSRIWVGTRDGKVFFFENDTFHPFEIQTSHPIGRIHAILPFKGGGLWLGTAAAGIVVVSNKNVLSIGKKEGLPDDSISQLIEDNNGHVWCSSLREPFRIEKSDVAAFLAGEKSAVTPLILGKDEGLSPMASIGPYGPGTTKSEDGTIWIATRDGLLAIDPEAKTLTPKKPQVKIETIAIDGAQVALSKFLKLPIGAKKMEIRFSVLCLSAPTRAKTWYRLDGFDSEWTPASPNHTALYPRLPPGEYHFEVRSDFADVENPHSVDSFTIKVSPNWRQRAWVQVTFIVVLILGCTWIVRSWSVRRLNLRLRKLEQEATVVRERARIAQNIHDDVGASLTRISLLTQASTNAQQQSRSLERIYEVTREITRSLDEIVWAVNPEYDTVESFVGYLTTYTQNFLSAANIRCRISCDADTASAALNSESRHQLYLCCKELLNNVVKHAGATEVSISIEKKRDFISVIIFDNGRGDSTATSNKDRTLSGHGLKNINDRMNKLGGSFQIEMTKGTGTRAALIFPTNAVLKMKP